MEKRFHLGPGASTIAEFSSWRFAVIRRCPSIAFAVTPVVVALLILEPPFLVTAAEISRREYLAATRDLSVAVKAGDDQRFLDAASKVLLRDDTKAVRAVLEGYSRLCDKLVSTKRALDVSFFHRETLKLFEGVDGAKGTRELERSRTKSKYWRVRYFLLDLAMLHRSLDLAKFASDALDDESPFVIRRSVEFLAKDRTIETVDRLVARLESIEPKTAGRGRDRDQWYRTTLAIRSALQRLLGVDLPVAADWKNFLSSRRDDPDLLDPKARRAASSGRSAVTLFGAAVTGKNIVFVLDVSGSMLSTDPVPADGEGDDGPRTVVGKPKRGVPADQVENRRRITRAKKELRRVVRSLASDVKFNVVSYSSEVQSWKRGLVPAKSSENKDSAEEYVENLEADGVTVTDDALREAFTDPAVDTIYLITDGAPTHVGSQGPGLPEDSRQLMGLIHEEVRTLNFLRDVRIFTLGFHGAEVDFLEKLATEHRGRFVAIR